MKVWLYVGTVIMAGMSLADAQVASHAPVASRGVEARKSTNKSIPTDDVTAMAAKPVARVNGAVLAEIDLRREMYTIFPYAQQHGGFPKGLEADIRKGALDMIIFEELLYQEAKHRNLKVAPERMARAQASFRKQFPDEVTYQQYVKAEGRGDKAIVREKIRRSLLIEEMLKLEVKEKATVTAVEVKTYYDKNPKQFEHGETFSLQTISIIPPENASREIQNEAKAKIKDIARLAHAAKTARDFGLIAEQVSDDDWRTKLGDRGTVDIKKLPPEIVKAAQSLKLTEVSAPIQVDRAWVVFRLNAHTPAGKTSFAMARQKLQADLQKQKTLDIRAELNQKLRKTAKVEVL